jgi:hypothetical protein
MTLGDLSMEMDTEDAVFNAVRDLTARGLLHREGALVFPTRAALHFDRLDA